MLAVQRLETMAPDEETADARVHEPAHVGSADFAHLVRQLDQLVPPRLERHRPDL
jgi:hypothetical protein